MKYQAVIWDIDGTLLNTEEGLVAAYQYTIEKLKLPHKTAEEIKGFIGPVPQVVFQEKFMMNSKDAQAAADIFRNRYKNFELFRAVPYAGIMEVLRKIKSAGIKQAVATNKRQDYAVDICRYFGIDDYCHPILGPDNVNTKTKSDFIKECVSRLGVEKAVMIGDTNGDKNAAEEAESDFLGVNYGFGFKRENGYADTPADIAKILGVS